MGVNGIGFGAPAVDMAGPSGGGGNPRLKVPSGSDGNRISHVSCIFEMKPKGHL